MSMTEGERTELGATRPQVVARIISCVRFLICAAPGSFAHDKPLVGQRVNGSTIDSLDLVEIEMEVDDAFNLDGRLDLQPDASIDSIADAVMAAGSSQ